MVNVYRQGIIRLLEHTWEHTREHTRAFKIGVLCCFTVCVGVVFSERSAAQGVRVQATLDTASLLIGEQTLLRLRVEYPEGIIVRLPSLNDSLMRGVEVLESVQLDSAVQDGRVVQSRGYRITSFEAGKYMLPPLPVVYQSPNVSGEGRIESASLLLTVLPVRVDSAQGFTDIKSPLEVPINFMELLPYLVAGVVVLAVIAAGVWYIRKRPEPEEPVVVVPKRPAHEVAMESLERLRAARLWQHGKPKEFYTELTQILWEYVGDAFGIKTFEATTDEILHEYRTSQRVRASQRMVAGSSDALKTVLEAADLVKFARFEPLPEDNERALNLAFEFVSMTQPLSFSEPIADPDTVRSSPLTSAAQSS